MPVLEALQDKALYLAVLGTAKTGSIGLADAEGNVLLQNEIGPLAYRINPDFNNDISRIIQDFALGKARFDSLTEFAGTIKFACFALAGAIQPIDCFSIRSALIQIGFSDTTKILITDDIHAVLAATGQQTGIVAKISSGVCLFGRKSETEHFMIGGRDSELSDPGSGYWLGLKVLQLLLDAYDGRLAPDPIFRTAMLKHLQLTEELQITPWYYETKKTRDWKHRISDLAIPLSELAANKNKTALDLLEAAAREIALTIDAAARKAVAAGCTEADSMAIVVAGNFWRHSAQLRTAVQRMLRGREVPQPTIKMKTAQNHTFLGALCFAVSQGYKIPDRGVLERLSEQMLMAQPK